MTTISHGCRWCEREFRTADELVDHVILDDHRRREPRYVVRLTNGRNVKGAIVAVNPRGEGGRSHELVVERDDGVQVAVHELDVSFVSVVR